MSELITQIKDDIGITDLPKPFDDIQLANRIKTSALRDFSTRYPNIVEFTIGSPDMLSEGSYDASGTKYAIPKAIYEGSKVLMVTQVLPKRPNGYSDMYVPQGAFYSPDQTIMSIASIRVAAANAQSVAKALTWKFVAPDVLTIYNGWSAGTYDVTAGLMHDESLSTIPDTAFTNFRDLAELDIKEFLYNRLKRKNNLDIGIGNIDLKIDDWQDAGREKKDLLKDWDEDGNLNLDSIIYF
jgi:hypothetical protein